MIRGVSPGRYAPLRSLRFLLAAVLLGAALPLWGATAPAKTDNKKN